MLGRPGHGVTIGVVERAYHADRTLVPRLLEVPQLPEFWVGWAQHFIAVTGR